MSNYHVEPVDKPQALTKEAIKSLRKSQVQGLSRRQLMRTALGTAVGLWLLEVSAGTIGFIWPNLTSGFGSAVRIGTLDDVKATADNLPIDEGFPAYNGAARAFIMLVDPGQLVVAERQVVQRRQVVVQLGHAARADEHRGDPVVAEQPG